MKRILLLVSIILGVNVLFAQNTFTIGDLTYKPTTGNNVKVRSCSSSATSVVVPSTVDYNGMTYNVTCIGEDAFSWCTSLTSVEMPNTITSIESFAFYYTTALTSIVIPNSVTSMGWEVFYNCTSLSSVTIGSGITELSDGTFYDCNSIQNIICLGTVPPTLENSYVFPSSVVSTANLNVPCGALAAYSDASNLWGQLFAGRISEIAYTINAFANDSAWGSVELVSDCDAATLTATANNCYEFVSWSDGNTENPRVLTLTGDTEITAVFAQAELGSSITATICEGSSYSENGFETNEAGVYTQTLQTENGCDSIVELTLSIAPVYNEVIEATINAGETYTENGFNESETGTYVQTLQSEFGCDSTITLNLLVNASLMDVEGVEVSFYPNPTKANLSFNMMIEKIELMDLSGRMLMNFENANNINIESLPIGTYYLLLHLKDKAIMRKIVKQ